jgi:uncharacterized protein DUF6893
MIKRALRTALVLGIAYVVVSSLPDLARYIKIRET